MPLRSVQSRRGIEQATANRREAVHGWRTQDASARALSKLALLLLLRATVVSAWMCRKQAVQRASSHRRQRHISHDDSATSQTKSLRFVPSRCGFAGAAANRRGVPVHG
jgi:hypothetical protein